MERFNVIQDICEKLGLTQINNSWIETLGAHLNIPQIPGNDNYEKTVFVEAISNSEVVSSGTYQTATVNITPAQILTLNSAPVQLLPAPGAGQYIELVSAVVGFINGTIAYNPITPNYTWLSVGYSVTGSGSEEIHLLATFFNTIPAALFESANLVEKRVLNFVDDYSITQIFSGIGNKVKLSEAYGIGGYASDTFVNLPLYLYTGTDYTDGNCELRVDLTYRIIDFN